MSMLSITLIKCLYYLVFKIEISLNSQQILNLGKYNILKHLNLIHTSQSEKTYSVC